RVIEEGTGVKPSATNTVEVHYRGTLLNGEEFDSSYRRNQTATFPLNRVIEGWTEGLQLMSVGSKYEFFIPAYLAYGDTPPQGSPIKAGSVLVFEVELIDIVR
ncbi:MAG: FKBP-type peptidyl-prolyl cis-trans isomerase, partial [Balneolaceae bacterium]